VCQASVKGKPGVAYSSVVRLCQVFLLGVISKNVVRDVSLTMPDWGIGNCIFSIPVT